MAETVYTPSLSDVGPALGKIAKAINNLANAERAKTVVLQNLSIAISKEYKEVIPVVQTQTDEGEW